MATKSTVHDIAREWHARGFRDLSQMPPELRKKADQALAPRIRHKRPTQRGQLVIPYISRSKAAAIQAGREVPTDAELTAAWLALSDEAQADFAAVLEREKEEKLHGARPRLPTRKELPAPWNLSDEKFVYPLDRAPMASHLKKFSSKPSAIEMLKEHGCDQEADEVAAWKQFSSEKAAAKLGVGMFKCEIAEAESAESPGYLSASWGLREHLLCSCETDSRISKASCIELTPGWCRKDDAAELTNYTALLDHSKAVLNRQDVRRFRCPLKFCGRISGRPALLHVVVAGGRDSPKQFTFNPLKPLTKATLASESGPSSRMELSPYLMRTGEAKLPLDAEVSEGAVEFLEEEFVLPTDWSQWELVKMLANTGHAAREWQVVVLDERCLSKTTTRLLRESTDYGTPARARFPARPQPAKGQSKNAFEEGVRVAMRSVSTSDAAMKLEEILGDPPTDDNEILIQSILEEGVDIAAAIGIFGEHKPKVVEKEAGPDEVNLEESEDGDKDGKPKAAGPKAAAKASGAPAPAPSVADLVADAPAGAAPAAGPARPHGEYKEHGTATDFSKLQRVLGATWPWQN